MNKANWKLLTHMLLTQLMSYIWVIQLNWSIYPRYVTRSRLFNRQGPLTNKNTKAHTDFVYQTTTTSQSNIITMQTNLPLPTRKTIVIVIVIVIVSVQLQTNRPVCEPNTLRRATRLIEHHSNEFIKTTILYA